MSKSKLFTFLLIFLSFSAIFCFYNFDSASAYTGTITYNAGTDTITAVGGTSETPITFNDLYLADVANGWNQVSKQGENQFLFDCKIYLGTSNTAKDTYFTDADKQITFNNGSATAHDENMIFCDKSAVLTLGVLSDANLKGSSHGCQFNVLVDTYWGNLIYYANGSNVFLYSCSFNSQFAEFWVRGADRVWNCQFFGYSYLHGTNLVYTDVDVHNVICSTSFGIRRPLGNWHTNNLIIYASTGRQVWFQSYPSVLNNIYARGTGRPSIFMENTYAYDYYMIDCDVSPWTFQYTGTNTGKVYRQYTFNLNVLNGNITDFVQNANVSLIKDGIKIYSALTNSSGMIPTQTLTYGYYQQSTGDTIQNATSPYYLVITHPDWQTYVSRFYITEPLRLTVSMQEPTYTGYTEAEKSDYTTIILFVISLILCIIGLALTVPLLPLIALTVSVINVLLLTEISVLNILLIILNVIFTVITIVRVKTKNN